MKSGQALTMTPRNDKMSLSLSPMAPVFYHHPALMRADYDKIEQLTVY